MNTKIVQYEKGDAGYTAMVNSFKELFSWADISEYEGSSSTNPKYTIFTMPGDGNSSVGLKVRAGNSSNGPSALAFLYNGSNAYESSPGGLSSFTSTAYAYGDGFFVACGSGSAFPASDGNVKHSTVGIARSRNMLTGDTEYCSFAVNSNNYSFFVQSTMDDTSRSCPLFTNASVGAAISLHDPDHLLVADNILLLTAIPDTITACLSEVLFNGTPYTRLGRLLIPA